MSSDYAYLEVDQLGAIEAKLRCSRRRFAYARGAWSAQELQSTWSIGRDVHDANGVIETKIAYSDPEQQLPILEGLFSNRWAEKRRTEVATPHGA
ncbi:Hypothetical predicted protein [Lecanosticta acicola]|uniref:Uncharacterized protein n=1 Tax=Lecanosticta acicola TaxID=111012 RepID=A0AAI8Z5P3_9PEZI|nr:Hypothetical predicted protein [Lecanosticta acicola]